jgi:hypothetical protein
MEPGAKQSMAPVSTKNSAWYFFRDEGVERNVTAT